MKETMTSLAFFCNVNRRVVLYIPSDYDGKFNIETVSGDVLIN